MVDSTTITVNCNNYLCDAQAPGDFLNFVSIVALSTDINKILLDGAPLNVTNTSSFVLKTIGIYSVISGPVTTGSHWLNVVAGSTATFAAYVYGHASLSTNGSSAYGFTIAYQGNML